MVEPGSSSPLPPTIADPGHAALRALVEASLVLAFRCDGEGRIAELNEPWGRALGCELRLLLGRPLAALQTDEARGRFEAAWAALAAGATSAEAETVLQVAGGPALLLQLRVVPVRGGDGRLVAVMGSAIDLTERRRTEAALARRERLVEEIQAVARLGWYELEVATGRWSSSRELDVVFGLDEAYVRDVAGWVALVHPTMREEMARYFAEEVLREGRFDREYLIRRADDGEARWVHGLGTVEFDAARRPVRMMGTIQDIDERRRADEVLRESEQRFRTLVEGTGDGIGIVDLEERFVFANPAAEEIFGVAPDALVGRNVAEFLAPDLVPAMRAKLEERGDGGASKYELEIQRPDGARRTLVVTTTTRRDPQGNAVGSFGVFRDVTERRQVQAQLAQHDRLSSMGLLAAGVAHEINNPLAYVLSNVDELGQELPRLVRLLRRFEAALRERLDERALTELAGDGAALLRPAALEELAESAQAALEGTRRIGRIARGLGTFSKVERVELDAVDLNLAIEHAVTMAHNEVKFRATLVRELGDVPPVLGSEGKLAQVFLNLIINATHAIGEGHVDAAQIRVRTWPTADGVFAEVSDTGPGIRPELLERIFEPFFTTKKAGVGSGLGLSICRNIVGEFGGELRASSVPGEGARFLVRLRPARPSTAALPTGDASTVAARRARILVVDDEPQIRKVLARILGRTHEVQTAVSGRDARELLERDPSFDVILCDLMMPDMTGMELHAWLAATAPHLARRVVFLTGGAFTPRASEYVEQAGNVRLEKPFDPRQLERAIAGLLTAGS